MSFTVVSEIEVRGSGRQRRLLGWLQTLDDGKKVFVARRQHKHIHRAGKQTISSAMTADVASWGMDEELLFGMRAKGVSFIGVKVEDTGDFYITRISNFFDRKKFFRSDLKDKPYAVKRQIFVPISHFALKRGVAVIDDSKLY